LELLWWGAEVDDELAGRGVQDEHAGLGDGLEVDRLGVAGDPAEQGAWSWAFPGPAL
jgi:hypothetical protein